MVSDFSFLLCWSYSNSFNQVNQTIHVPGTKHPSWVSRVWGLPHIPGSAQCDFFFYSESTMMEGDQGDAMRFLSNDKNMSTKTI